jgi:hypothetical protein
MNIWIVEDNDADADKALTITLQAASKEGLRATVFRDPNILWAGDLIDISGKRTVRKSGHMPELVILDLFDGEGAFRAATYYSSLRREEIEQERSAAFVIVWSVKTGLDDVETFVTEMPGRDRRLTFAEKTGGGAILLDSLSRCIRSRNEAVYL